MNRQDPRLAEDFDPGAKDATVEAVGKVTDALETIEVARGHLYAFHRMIGTAEREISAAVHLLADAGHDEEAARLRHEFSGRDVLADGWSFQVVEEFDGNFYASFRQFEADIRGLVGGHRHLHEAALKRRLASES